jgi:aminoglycoside phosphotransferase (APT) family kinase protein
MEYLDGRIFWDPRLPEIDSAGERTAMYQSMNAVIAVLHGVDYGAVGLGDFGRPGNYMGRQIARWSRQYRASETAPITAMDRLIDWLPQHLPPEGAPAIVHGDYRLDNLVFHKTEPRIIGVLDWELSTIGDPLADFAYHVMVWRVTPELFRGLGGVDVAALRIPDEAAYVTDYCRRSGRNAMPGLDFYMVYSLFRIAAILQGIAKRALDGTAAGADAVDQGRLAGPLAELAWALAQSL